MCYRFQNGKLATLMLLKNFPHIFLASVLLLTELPLAAKTIDVLAVDYPPFTSPESKGNGIAFELLENALGQKGITWKATYAPPARAASIIRKGEWCASFYPVVDEFDSVRVVLSKGKVTIGLVRKKEDSVFKWIALRSLTGNSVAILRTRKNSPFVQQFIDAGLEVLFVENTEIGIKFVEEELVDYALSDNLSFAQLNKKDLEFSQTSILTTPITLYVNPTCDLGNLLTEFSVD
jgi:polar amino acid transport system substrate-binding protein